MTMLCRGELCFKPEMILQKKIVANFAGMVGKAT